MRRQQNRRRRPRKRERRQRRIQTRPEYHNIVKLKPKNFFADLYIKNVTRTAISEKPLKPFELSNEQMNEFTPLLENITSFKKKKTFKELFEILDIDRSAMKKDKRIRKTCKKNRKNLVEEIVPETITDILNFIKEKFVDREISSPFHLSHFLLQSHTILSGLGRTKHLRELTCTNRTVEVFSDLLGSNLGYGERLLVLDMLSFLASNAYLMGIQELSRRYQHRKEREKHLKEEKEKEKKKKREEKEKERKKKERKKKERKGKHQQQEEEEGEGESDDDDDKDVESEEEEEEEDEDEDEDDIEEDEYMKRLQARAHIKDDELYDSVTNLKETMSSLSFIEKLSESLYLPPKRVCIVCSQLSLKILHKLLLCAYEDRDHFEELSYRVILGKDIDFAAHFQSILDEFTESNEEEEEEEEEQQQQQQQKENKKEEEEEEEEEQKNKRKTTKFNKDREILSYVLSCLFYISYNPSKKIHRKLNGVYDKLIDILLTQSDIYKKSKPKKSAITVRGGGKKQKQQKQKKRPERVKLDWTLITSVCAVISNLGGQNPHLARQFADDLIEDLIHLLEYAHYSSLENLECYAALTVLVSTCNSLEMRQYLEDTSLLKFVRRDLQNEKKVEMVYPPLLLYKTILGIFASDTNNNFEDNFYAMQLVSHDLKSTERVFRFCVRIFDYQSPPGERNPRGGGGGGGKKKKKKAKKKKAKNLGEEELKKRDKEMKFAWPSLLTTIHMISNCRRRMYRRSPTELKGLALEEFDKMTSQFDRIGDLIKISDNVSRLKKKAFSYKKVLVLFVIIVSIILILPFSYSFLGLGKDAGKDGMGEDGEDGGGI